MEVRAEHFKKAGSTPSDASIETLMICTYSKDPGTFVPSTK